MTDSSCHCTGLAGMAKAVAIYLGWGGGGGECFPGYIDDAEYFT